MRYGAHLPLIDFDGRYGTLAANDHLAFQRPWLDGIVALASVVEPAAKVASARERLAAAQYGPGPDQRRRRDLRLRPAA